MAGDKKFTATKPNGWQQISDPLLGNQEWDSLQCVHCGYHWRLIPGSRKQRGWCSKCSGPVCGPRCAECMPVEKQLDLAEKYSAGGIIIP